MLNEIFTLFSLVCASGSLIFLSIDFFSIFYFFLSTDEFSINTTLHRISVLGQISNTDPIKWIRHRLCFCFHLSNFQKCTEVRTHIFRKNVNVHKYYF